MASVYDLKPRFQALLRPLVRALARHGVTANEVTIGALLLSVATGLLIAWTPDRPQVLLLLPPMLLVRMALNAMDGMLAREHGQTSALGAMLNELGDVAADAAMYLPLALVPGFDARLVVLVVVLAVMSEMAGVIGVQIGASRRYDGPMGKSDRAGVMGAMGLVLGLGVRADSVIRLVLAATAALLGVTILNRARRALVEVKAGAAPR